MASSLTLTLNGKGSELSANYYPPIELDPVGEYVCGLVDFQTYMSIPNVNETNNNFIVGSEIIMKIPRNEAANYGVDITNGQMKYNDYPKLLRSIMDFMNQNLLVGLVDSIESVEMKETENNIAITAKYYERIKIPVGSYELEDIVKHLTYVLEKEKNATIAFSVNNNTLKCQFESSLKVLFNKERNTIGSIFGFDDGVYWSNQRHISQGIVRINPINVIKIETNITTGAYSNDKLMRTLHEFYPDAVTGYKIIEVPKNIIYLPLSVRVIQYFRVRVVDQDNRLIDFRGETVTLRVHIKRIK